MYHNYISRKYNEKTNIKINDDEKIKIIDIINKMITQEEKYEFYYIYKDTFKKFIPDQSKIQPLIHSLRSINLELWDIENGKRLAEKNSDFGKKFIELARSVYQSNDKRSEIKLEINDILGSNIKEVKSHY